MCSSDLFPSHDTSGALLQQVNRDTYGFAMKTSAIKIDGVWKDVFKNPIGDSMKKSKAGFVKYEINGVDQMIDVYENGKLLVDYNFDDIRN